VNTESFEESSLQGGKYYFEPFNSQLQPVLSRQQVFAMQRLVSEARVFGNASYAVVPCDGVTLVDYDAGS
jgi:hypothetical protein